jgi:co-chaperonin GroES (HSP10)
MEWNPIGDQLLLKVAKVSEKTKSGIILVDRDMQFTPAEVVKVGPGIFTMTGDRIPMTVKPGDSVLIYKSNLGENKSVMLDDEEYYLIRESEVGLVKSAE